MASRKAAPVDAALVAPAAEPVDAAPVAPAAEPNVPFSQAKGLIERKKPGGAALLQGHFLRPGCDDTIDRPRPMREWIQLLKSVVEGG